MTEYYKGVLIKYDYSKNPERDSWTPVFIASVNNEEIENESLFEIKAKIDQIIKPKIEKYNVLVYGGFVNEETYFYEAEITDDKDGRVTCVKDGKVVTLDRYNIYEYNDFNKATIYEINKIEKEIKNAKLLLKNNIDSLKPKFEKA